MQSRFFIGLIVGVTLAGMVSAKAPLGPEYLRAGLEAAKIQVAEAKAALADTGDSDSFGRNVKFIGVLSSGVISLAGDCTPDPSAPPGPEDHCFVIAAAPAPTAFSVVDAARMRIPGSSAKSLLCHWQTPFVDYAFSNPLSSYRPDAQIFVTPTYQIENSVLSDPGLINPFTGLPFGGVLRVSLPGVRHSRGLQPGDFQPERDNSTRVCLGGMISKRDLIENYGLSPALANKFFRVDTTITMSLAGSATLVDFATIAYGTRFVGD
jgi:hypothetical protein